MPKEEIIKEAEQWVEDNYPDKEIAYMGIESIHESGQKNYAIYDASDDKVIQENDYENPDSENHREFEYNAHK